MTTAAVDAIRILHVDDRPDFTELAATFLERVDDRFAVETASSVTDGIAMLDEGDFDCIVSDYDMPERTGIEFLTAVREEHPEVPFILFTGKGSEEVASDAISAGVTDYLQKETGTDQYTVLANRIVNAVEHYRSRQMVERSERRLREVIDSLPHILYVVDEDGRYLLANEALAEFHDTTVSEIEGANMTAVLDEAEAERFHREHDDVLASDAGKRAGEVRVTDASGDRHVFEPEMMPYDFADAGNPAVLGIGVDVTERRKRERNLERTQERMQLALEHTDSIIFEIDFESGAMIRHGTFEQVFDRSPEDVPSWGAYLDTVVHPDDRETVRQFYEALRAGRLESGEIEYRTDSAGGETRRMRDNVYAEDASETGSRQAVGVARDVTDRKERKRELRKKERRYRAIFNDPNILVGLIDTDGTVLDISQTAMEYVDADPEEVLGTPFWETPWFDHSVAVRRDVRDWIERAASGKYVEFEVDLERPDGDPYSIQGVFRPVRDEDGEVVSLIISDREITAQKARERELQQTNALLSTLFDALPVGVLAEDGARNVLAANQQVFDHFDMPGAPEEVIGSDRGRLAREVSERFVESDRFVERIDELATAREPVRNEELRLTDGRTLAQSHHPIELADGDGHLWVYRDVTDRVAREQRLEVLNETTRQLMTAQSREAVAEIGVDAASEVLDLDANAIHVHDETESSLVPIAQSDGIDRIIGEPPTLTAGDSIAWRVYERGEAVALDDIRSDPDTFNPDSPFRSELYLPLGEHGLLIAGATTAAAFDQQDVVLGEILAGNIAAALDQVERTEQLHARERELTRQNDRLEEFASIASHDLRNPLNVADGHLDLATDECESEHLEKVASALDRMDILIADLLALARDGRRGSEMEPVDLAALSRDCWRNVETAAATLTAETTQTVRADPSRLKQLLENLYRNAVEHGGDDVTVAVCDAEEGFAVEDDGPGIPSDRRDTVFDIGYSTSEGGTGFGLSIVERVAASHGWDVTVTESGDGGTRFEITAVETGRRE